MRSRSGTNVGPSLVVTAVTNSTIDFFVGPSFHEGRGSSARQSVVAATTAMAATPAAAGSHRRRIVAGRSGKDIAQRMRNSRFMKVFIRDQSSGLEPPTALRISGVMTHRNPTWLLPVLTSPLPRETRSEERSVGKELRG